MTSKIIVPAFFLIILLELFARFYIGLGDPPIVVSHPTIEYMFKPNQSVKRFGNSIQINQYGMRSNKLKKKEHNEIRIAFFGDSVLNGGSLTDQKDLATSLLQEKLKNKFHENISILNISAGSWGPGNWLAYIKKYGFFNADIICILISSHDYNDNPTFESLDNTQVSTYRPFLALEEVFIRYIPRYLAFGKEIKDDFDNVDPVAIKKGLSDLYDFLVIAKKNTSHIIVFQYPELIELKNNLPKEGFARILEVVKNWMFYVCRCLVSIRK